MPDDPRVGAGYHRLPISRTLVPQQIKPANEYIESQLGQGVGERCRVIKGDFFKASTGAYDIGYD